MPSWREEATEREAARRRAIDEEEVQIRPQTGNRQNDVANELGLGGGDQAGEDQRRQQAGRSPFRIRDDEERKWIKDFLCITNRIPHSILA